MAPAVTAATVSDDPQTYEDTHVHAVYDEIAPHFSSTRYKPWPIIARFLASLPTGWVGLDSGTGNGKYLPLPLNRPGGVWTIGLDRSRNLLEIARRAGGEGESRVLREVVWGDVLGRGWREGAFDYAISIATIHHLSTHERRKVAVQRLIQSVSSSHGRVLIYVWAIEQDNLSKRSMPTMDEAAGQAHGQGQDVFVPWVLSPQIAAKGEGNTKRNSAQDNVVAAAGAQKDAGGGAPRMFSRYYHMFAKGELGELVCEAARELELCIGSCTERLEDSRCSTPVSGIEIMQDGWERSNYYVEFRRWTV